METVRTTDEGDQATRAAGGVGTPIARIWRGWTSKEQADAYEHIVSTDVLPSIAERAHPGYSGAYLLRRELDREIEFATIMLFDSHRALAAFAGPGHEAAYVPPQARAVLARFDERSAHFSVLLTPTPISPSAPVGGHGRT